MPDSTTTTKSPSKSDLQDENDRLRALLEQNNINPDEALDPNRGIVGNLADLQRLGAIAASDAKTNVDDAVVKPASFDPDTGRTEPAEPVAG